MRLVLKVHKHNFLITSAAALAVFIALFKLQGMPKAQYFALSILIVFYLFWAILYHYYDKSLKLEVMIEYILTALLALVILYGVLL